MKRKTFNYISEAKRFVADNAKTAVIYQDCYSGQYVVEYYN